MEKDFHFYVTYAIANRTAASRDNESRHLESETGFEKTDRYRFQMAARANLVLVTDMLKSY